jgi:predicted butyrate kinase (DUF1464 family)
MPRVIGIDAGTVTVDLVGLDNGRVFLERSFPVADVLADASILIAALEGGAPLDLVVAPSGYGLPVTAARDLTDDDLALAFLAAPGEPGGIAGLKALLRALASLPVDVVVTPGVVHLPTVPPYRKANRVDMGTSDKVCAAALAVHEQCARLGCGPEDVSFILLELGGAFTAAIAVEQGRIVDGLGGSSGPIGARASGALDGEVAFLAGHVSKQMIFIGGAAAIGGEDGWTAYRESALKAIAALSVSAPLARDIILSGRHAPRLGPENAVGGHLKRTVLTLGGSVTAKQGAHGAALVADGLAGGAAKSLVTRLAIREASGTVLDHLYVIAPAVARARLGIGTG